MLVVDIFRWPAFALMRCFSMDDALHKLLYLLLIGKKYGTVKKMLKQLSAGSTKSETSKLTVLEENLFLEAQVWEHRLRRDFETKAVTRLAAIYEKQCLESKAYEFLKLSVDLNPDDLAILNYFSTFCQRFGYWEDARRALTYHLNEDPENNIVKRNLINVQLELKKSEIDEKGNKPLIRTTFSMENACAELSKFFANESYALETVSTGYPHIVSLTHSDITNDNRVKKIAACISMRGFKSTLIGPSSSDRVERGYVGDANVIKIPVSRDLRQSVRTNIGGNPFRYKKINLLRTMIYCLKSSTKRFYCTRGSQVNKSEPSKWFSEINKEKSRQKYWYYYENEYYNKTIESWPYPDMERKVRGERILN